MTADEDPHNVASGTATLPEDVAGLVERLLQDLAQLGKMTEHVQFVADGMVRVKDPSTLMGDLREAAYAISSLEAELARVKAERDRAMKACEQIAANEKAALARMKEALRIGRGFIADELRQTLECVCLLDKETLEPILSTMDPMEAEAVGRIEEALAIVDALLAEEQP